MRTQNKIIITVVVSVVSVAFFLMYQSQFKRERFFTCKSNVNYTLHINNDAYNLRAAYAIVIDNMEYSNLTINGKLQHGEKMTEISRSYAMSMTHAKGNYFKVIITSQEINDSDTTDNSVFTRFFMPQKEGVPFYTQISNLRKNVYIIRGLSSPYLACLSY